MEHPAPSSPPHVELSKVAPGADILRHVSRNQHKRWGGRYDEAYGPLTAVARLAETPLPDLKISPKFTIAKAAKVFAFGSCFARHLEMWLQKSGVQVLSRKYEGIPQEVCETNPSQTLNKYNPSSILDQLVISLESSAHAEEMLIETVEDSFFDLSSCNMKPCSLDQARSIQQIQTDAFSEIRRADLVVITLGLTETWIDLKYGRACNRAPPLNRIKGDNSRFGFYNHDVAATTGVINSIVGLLREKLGADLKIIFTLSPVPLASTFTTNDVIVANCYSKSVLRAAVTPIVETDPFLDYFPSYELVTLSEPTRAWERDRRHVTTDTVAAVIEQFIRHYLVG